MGAAIEEQAELFRTSRTRLRWLEETEATLTGRGASPVEARARKRQRLDVLIANHMAAEGHTESSAALAARAGVSDLVDSGVHAELFRVSCALRDRDCAPALRWCAENRSKLRRAGSTPVM